MDTRNTLRRLADGNMLGHVFNVNWSIKYLYAKCWFEYIVVENLCILSFLRSDIFGKMFLKIYKCNTWRDAWFCSLQCLPLLPRLRLVLRWKLSLDCTALMLIKFYAVAIYVCTIWMAPNVQTHVTHTSAGLQCFFHVWSFEKEQVCRQKKDDIFRDPFSLSYMALL